MSVCMFLDGIAIDYNVNQESTDANFLVPFLYIQWEQSIR